MFPELPFWSHVSTSFTSRLHQVLFMSHSQLDVQLLSMVEISHRSLLEIGGQKGPFGVVCPVGGSSGVLTRLLLWGERFQSQTPWSKYPPFAWRTSQPDTWALGILSRFRRRRRCVLMVVCAWYEVGDQVTTKCTECGASHLI